MGGTPAVILRELQAKDIAAWDKSKEIYIELAKKCSTPGMLKRID